MDDPDIAVEWWIVTWFFAWRMGPRLNTGPSKWHYVSFDFLIDLLIAINMNGYVTVNQLIKPFWIFATSVYEKNQWVIFFQETQEIGSEVVMLQRWLIQRKMVVLEWEAV